MMEMDSIKEQEIIYRSCFGQHANSIDVRNSIVRRIIKRNEQV